MAWTRGIYEVYESVDLITAQPVLTSVTVPTSYEYYVYAFTVSEHKTVRVELVEPGSGYRRPGGIYYIGVGDVPDPAVIYDDETGSYEETSLPGGGITRQVDLRYQYAIEFEANPGTLYWIWMVPTPASRVYAIRFSIQTSDKYAEPVFDAENVGTDGLAVKVLDGYGMINGTCQIFINDIYQDDLAIKSSFNWQTWGISNLNAGEYTIKVQYLYNDGTGDSWKDMRYYFGYSDNTRYTATVKIQGAGSAGNAYFTATGDSSTNTIMIDINDYRSITPSADHFIYNISEKSEAFPTNEESYAVTHDFTNLRDGEWRVTVYAVLTNGRVIQIPTKAHGDTYAITITFGGSGGGGGGTETDEWSIVSENLGKLNSSYTNFRYYEKYTLYRYRATFEYSGTVTFYSATGTTVALADPEGWITEYTTTYNSDVGQPPQSALEPGKYAYDNNSGGSSQFSMTFNVSAGTEYCFWFRLTDGSKTGYTYLGIEPPTGSSTAWKYNESYLDIKNISTTQTKDVRLQSYEGALFKVTFASAGVARFSVSIPGQTANIYVTTGKYSWATDGVPLTESGSKAGEISGTAYSVLENTEYYVWVKGVDANVRGTATVTIAFTQSWKYNYNSNLNIRNISTTRTQTTSVSRLTGSCFLVTFSVGGTAVFSVSGGDAYIAYSTDGYHQWDPEDGSPYRDDKKNKATGGTSVSIDVSTSDSYYVWVRGKTETTSGSGIVVTISIQTIDTKGFWIVINKGTQQSPNLEWVKTTVWVFSSGSYVKIRPYAGNSSGWIGGS